MSLESELVDLTQRFTILGLTRDDERAMIEAGCAKVSSRVDYLAMRLVQARFYIHYTLNLEYGSVDESNEPQLAFHRLQAEAAEKEEALRVATIEISTL